MGLAVRYLISISVFVFAYAQPAAAQEYSPYSAERSGSPQYRQCMTLHQNNIDEVNCLSAEYVRQNALVNLALAERNANASKTVSLQIAAAQKAWINFRSANCRVRNMTQGSGAGLFHYSCLVRETITRKMELSEVWDY
jgi:uncharacterized protein YecT (DUF1311 family)